MNSKYIKPFIEATQNVFENFFNIRPEPGKPFILDETGSAVGDISAVIGIGGESRGAVVISMGEDMACQLSSIVTASSISEYDENVVDTVGEVVNIIAGNAKQGLEDYRLVISLPSVIRGKEHQIAWPGKNCPIIAIPFEIPAGKMQLAVGLENILV